MENEILTTLTDAIETTEIIDYTSILTTINNNLYLLVLLLTLIIFINLLGGKNG